MSGQARKKVEPVYDNADDRSGGQWYTIGPAIIRYPYGATKAEEAEAEANATLIAEAFNVAAETGRTPAQLAAERAGLLEALAELVSAVEAEVNEKGAGGFLLARLTDVRAILAKVKGPVQS